MGTIQFECPATGRPISTGIETEPISFCRLSRTWVDLYCPECGRFHGAKIWLAQETSASACFSKSALSKQTHIALHRQPRLADHRLNRSCLRSAPSSKHRSNCIPSGSGSRAQSVLSHLVSPMNLHLPSAITSTSLVLCFRICGSPSVKPHPPHEPKGRS